MFFERFREAAARLPDGLLRLGPPGDPAAIAAVERALRMPLPADYASFLRSFDGVDLFHESILIAGAGPDAAPSLLDFNPASRVAGELTFAETAAGDRFVFAPAAGGAADAERAVIRVRGDSEERVLAGSSFTRWLDATVAREQILYGSDGEFAPEVFEADGEEVSPRIALRQAERALRHDGGSAEAHQDRGVALRRLGRAAEAADAFESAALLDPGNPWTWFYLGRAALEQDPRRASAAFRRAAAADAGPAGPRILAWAARAALAGRDPEAAGAARGEALARQPGLIDELRRAVDAAVADGDSDAAAEASLLVDAIAPGTARVRLPVVGGDDDRPDVSSPAPAVRRPPPARRPRPAPAAPPPAGASRRGRRR